MKRLICLALCLLVATTALGSHTEFYVTKGTSASDVNGGGPSLAANDAPVDTEANCSSDGAGTSVTNDDADGWAGSSVDDWICFDTAGAKDFARITNIAGDVLTVTPAVTINQAAKTVNVGGAWATIDHAASTVTTSFVNAAGSPPRVNVKYDAVAYTETVTTDNTGSAQVAISFEGYEATAGDGCPTPNLPQITGNWVFGVGDDYMHVGYFKIVTTANGTSSMSGAPVYCVLHNLHLKATGTATARGCSATGGNYNQLIHIYVEQATNEGLHLNSGHTHVIGCYIQAAGTYGIYLGLNGGINSVIANTIIDAPGDDCLYAHDEAGLVVNCTFYGSVAGSGINWRDSDEESGLVVINTILYGNNQYGVELNAAGRECLRNNAFGGNGVGAVDGNVRFNAEAITLTGDPFTNAAGHDLSLDATAGEGAACRNLAWPIDFRGSSTTSYLDLGAADHVDPAGGGGTVSPYRGRLSGGLE